MTDDWHPEPLEISTHHPKEGPPIIRVRSWPRQIEVDAAAIAKADHIECRGDDLTITADNGKARYYRVWGSQATPANRFQLESCWLQPGEG